MKIQIYIFVFVKRNVIKVVRMKKIGNILHAFNKLNLKFCHFKYLFIYLLYT